jgi:hypothetical protein
VGGCRNWLAKRWRRIKFFWSRRPWAIGARYEIVKRLGERPDALACSAVRDCTGINPATLSHHMKE